MTPERRLVCACALAMAAAWAATWAVPAPAQDVGALELEAESIHYDKNTGRSVYRGDVVVTRGDVRLTGDEVEVVSEDGEPSRITARARPGTFLHRSDGGELRAEAASIEYDVKQKLIVFSGGAKVDDGEKVLEGERIVYDLEKQTVDATKSKGRVRLTIDP